ncbi:MAG: Flp pilus assembly complex ATPase component TadA [Actinomycetaceae bacterium]|nr:Flp pilus assembly complex ATPase component TadA [Actinomycetaceae bacterium]
MSNLIPYPKVEWKTSYKDPFRFDASSQFKEMMLETLAQDASDVFVQPQKPVLLRVQGRMVSLTKRILDDFEIKNILRWSTNRNTAETDVVSGNPVNARYECSSIGERNERGELLRYAWRVNASPVQYRGSTSSQIVMRAIPDTPPLPEQLGLTPELVESMTPRDGIVYVAGATGSGKTTTFAAIIRHILENDTPIKGNLITHEEPIEFSYHNVISKHSVIVQSQIPNHFKDFAAANREAMRRKPGLILVGEMRDEETIKAAVEAALTGHPVFGTVHAVNVATVMRRLISRYPEQERSSAIFDMLETVRVIMAQRLVSGTDGKLLALREYLVFDKEVRDALYDLDNMALVTRRINELVQEKGHSFSVDAHEKAQAGKVDETLARRILKEIGA